MKKLFTFLVFLISILVYSQPVMDGNFDGETVWGAPKAIADDNTGWASAQAKKFYTTADANYLYLGAEVTASEWMAWAFIINTKPGGATSDSWARRVYYNHTDLPDFTARGQFGLPFGPWAEIYKWTGTSWQRDPDNGLPSTEWGENIGGSLADGWVEIRVPQSTLGSPSIGDIQFYITGDNDQHGCFDACPDDSIATSWSDSTTIGNYQSNIYFYKKLNISGLIQEFYDGTTMREDSVFVELCSTNGPSYPTLDVDTVIVNSAGQGSLFYYNNSIDASGSYYIKLTHRNAIETWSKTPQPFSSGIMTYDFTTAVTQAYGDNLVLKGGKYCFWSGDITQDGSIDAIDRSACWNDRNLIGYQTSDVNGDGNVDALDRSICWNNRNITTKWPGGPSLTKPILKVEVIEEDEERD